MIITFDIGGTTTKAGISADGNSFLYQITEKSCKPSNVGMESCAESIHNISTKLCAKVGIGFSDINGISIGVSGVATDTEQVELKSHLYRIANTRLETLPKTHITTDAECALVGALGSVEATGIVILSGTGSIAFGKKNDGTIERCGGYGYPISDEGSGTWIAIEAIKAIIAHVEGRGKKTKLTTELQTQFNINIHSDLREFVQRVHTDNKLLTQVPAIVFSLCNNDAIAQHILERTSMELAVLARALLTSFPIHKNIPCSVAGTIATHPVLMSFLEKQLSNKPNRLRFQQPIGNGLDGALLIGKSVWK